MKPTISTVGVGTAEDAPDSLVLRLVAVAAAPSVTDAVRTVAALVARAGETARGAEPGVTVASTGLQVWQRRDDSAAPATYEARHSLRVHCPTLDRAGRVVDALSEVLEGGFELEGIEPRISAPERLGVEARARAFADAEAKAEELAGLAGVRLGSVLRVEEGGQAQPRPMARAMAASLAETAFEPGTQAVSAVLAVTWRVVEG